MHRFGCKRFRDTDPCGRSWAGCKFNVFTNSVKRRVKQSVQRCYESSQSQAYYLLKDLKGFETI